MVNEIILAPGATPLSASSVWLPDAIDATCVPWPAKICEMHIFNEIQNVQLVSQLTAHANDFQYVARVMYINRDRQMIVDASNVKVFVVLA